MASITATQLSTSASGTRWALLLVGVTTAGAAIMFVVGAAVQSVVAGGHGQVHALFAAVFLAPAFVVAVRRPRGGTASTPAILGLTIAGLSQLIEGIGGFGYGPDNDSRVNALAQVHDLGVTIAPVGLVAAALGITAAVAQLLRPRFGLLPGLALAAMVVAGLGILIAKMIGI